jgi:hypothetical protein
MNPVPAAILLALASSALADPRPVRPLVPGPADRELKIPTLGPALPEGTFIAAARGQLAKGASGHLYFIFDPDAQGRRLPGVVLLPSDNLPAVERLAAQLGPTGRMDITGRILSYAGLNYLFVSAPPISAGSPAEPAPTPAPTPTAPKPDAPAPTSTPTPAPAADVQQPLSPDPTIDEIVADLDRAVGRRRDTRSAAPATTPDPTPTPTAAAPATPAATPVDDALLTGAVLVSRRGRLVRTPEGLLAFTPDAGADAPTAGPGVTGSQPLILLPSRTLESLESLAESAGERATYTLSGQITVYNSRAYLLPTFVTTNRPTDIVLPTQ